MPSKPKTFLKLYVNREDSGLVLLVLTNFHDSSIFAHTYAVFAESTNVFASVTLPVKPNPFARSGLPLTKIILLRSVE